ncbi:hypothetical protein BDQ12DRAFT_722479 [Crucibulum laeve]|uniref:Uncharacterized protein n=1 Tax=Crucibulum laeve TaxID=68775 RepID=A0A5C3M365_9AGAR|nr:hypothetical protein BDQ12DRAFT_722479 [Crucibulum laeve]
MATQRRSGGVRPSWGEHARPLLSLNLPKPDSSLSTSHQTNVNSSNSSETFLEKQIISESDLKIRHMPRWVFFFRIVGFVVMEVIFIGVALKCLYNPLVLNLSRYSIPAKGALTITFIIWQTLAVVCAQDIILHIFSDEWSAQLSSRGLLEPGITDQVSTLTSGMLQRIQFFFTGGATLLYRVALVAHLALLGLGGLAPGSMSVSYIILDTSMSLNVSELTISSRPDTDDSRLAIQRAAMVVHLEQMENISYGFDVEPPNSVFGWPPLSTRNSNSTIRYPTSVVKFSHSCSWEVPTPYPGLNIPAWNVGGVSWRPWSTYLNDSRTLNSVTGIIPLYQTLTYDARSAYLFVGGNATYRPVNPVSTNIVALDGIPTAYNASGFVLDGVSHNFSAPLASVLLCDPKPQISGGTVQLTRDNTLQVISSTQLSQQNMPNAAMQSMFAQGLLDATNNQEYYIDPEIHVNSVAGQIFMTYPSMGWKAVGQRYVQPLAINDIEGNLDRFMLSASKVYASGYSPNQDSLSDNSFSYSLVKALRQDEKMALVTNKGLIIITIVLVMAALILLILLYRLSMSKSRVPFDLRSILKILQEHQLSSFEVLENTSTPKPLPRLPVAGLGQYDPCPTTAS